MADERYKSIILCEPQCRGFEHAQFNAALVASFRCAFPDASLGFMGEETHVQRVRSWLHRWNDPGPIRWYVIPIVNPAAHYLRRTVQKLSTYRAPLLHPGDPRERLVVYCSTALKGVVLLKSLLRGRHAPKDVIALFHNQLPGLIPFSRFNKINLMFLLPHPRPLRFFVLGESIRQTLLQYVSFPPDGLAAIDLPSILSRGPLNEGSAAGTVCFGFLGVSLNKGFEEFASLARRLRESGSDATYSMVGTVNHISDTASLRDILPDAEASPIGEEEYQQRGGALTYVVWTAIPEDYELRASATFVDALVFGKPGIYLRNRYVEHYFRLFGDIGYLCDDLEDVFRVMRQVSEQFPRERYMKQVENISVARERFSPEQVGREIRRIMTS